MRVFEVSPVLAVVLALGCGGNGPPAETPSVGSAPAAEAAAEAAAEPPAGGAGAPAGGTAATKPAKASAGGGIPAGQTATDKPVKPGLDACNALLDHIQSVSSEAIDRADMKEACLNEWPETLIECFKVARDDGSLEACWPAH